MLGDVEETIYVVEDDDDEEETVKVSNLAKQHMVNSLVYISTDDQEAIRNAVR